MQLNNNNYNYIKRYYFIILNEIKKGSFGRVYEAKTKDGLRVAIKSISKKLIKGKKIEKRVRYPTLMINY